MSVTFYVEGGDNDDNAVNMCNRNARLVMEYIGLPNTAELSGEIKADELATLCGRRLMRAADAPPSPGFPDRDLHGALGARVIDCGLREGYLEGKTRLLWELARRHPKGVILWA